MEKQKFIPISLSVLIITALLLAVSPVSASNPAQIASPTPNLEGEILYTVQDNDTCLSIALRFLNGDVNKLIELNNLNTDCFITSGQNLLLGTFEPPTPTEGPSPTATSYIPTATPTPGTGVICVVLFHDVNGNSRKDSDEYPIAGGAISITDREGLTSLTGTTVIDSDPSTADQEPLCFENLPEDEYNISVGPPEGYNATTVMNFALSLKAGDNSIIDFGAQTSSAGAIVAEQQPGNEETRQRSPLLGIVGGVLVLVGIGMGIYLRVLRR